MDNKKITSNSFVKFEDVKRTRAYLMQYSVFRKLWEKDMAKRKSFGNPTEKIKKTDTTVSCPGFIISKMFEIRRFVMSVSDSDERTLLFLYYIHGENLESCAHKMSISDRTANRIHFRALEMASKRLDEYISQINNTVCYE